MVRTSHSTGCWTCRRRKVKCDEARPICERCQRGGFVCDGYGRKVLWIDQSEKFSKRLISKNTSSPPRSSATRPAIDVFKKSPSPFSLDAYITFTVKRLFGDGANGLDHNHEYWISSMMQDNFDHVSYTALKCLATTYFGQMQKRPDILLQGAHLYGKALLQLKTSIENPATAYDHQNVAATMALAHYEIIAYTGKYGWIQHAGGIGRLMELRGPESHQAQPNHTYFILSRLQITMQACMSRRQLCFERPEWKILPWANQPNTRTPADKLVDILTHVPGLFQECDRLNALAGAPIAEKRYLPFHLSGRAQGPEQGAWEAIRGKVIVLLKQLEQWRQQWSVNRKATALEKSPDPQTSLTWEPSLTYPKVVLHYSDFNTAYDVALYTMVLGTLGAFASYCRDPIDICIQVLGISKMNLPSMLTPRNLVPTPVASSNEGAFNRFPELPPLGTPGEDVAELAVRLMDYLLLEPHRGKGAFMVIILLRMCFLNYVVQSDISKLRWAMRTFRRIADATGLDLSRHMDGYEIIGKEMKIGTMQQRQMIDRVKEELGNSAV